MVSCLGDLDDVLESLDLEPDPDEDGDLWRESVAPEVVPFGNAGVGERGRSRSRSRRRVSLSSQFHASNSMFLRLHIHGKYAGVKNKCVRCQVTRPFTFITIKDSSRRVFRNSIALFEST